MARFDYGIALTGSIGSGKSTVASLLKLEGFAVIDADEISHEILDASADEVAAVFGREILGSDGKVDRKKLGQIVFADKNAREKLEAILHPKIRAEIYARAGALERTKTPYFVDIPLFFERGNYEFDEVCVVYAPESLLIKRVIKRNNLSEEAVKSRLAAQMSIEQKRALATYVIDNSGDLKALTDRVATLAQTIKEKYANL